MDQQSEEKRSLSVVATENSDDIRCRTFVIQNEDHTLGNSLRYIVMKNRDVEFCGYSVPHPSENKINFRIQSKSAAATDVLAKGLEDLNSVCQHVLKTFETSVENFKRTQIDQSSQMEVDT